MSDWRDQVSNDTRIMINQLIFLHQQIADEMKSKKRLGFLSLIFTTMFIVYSTFTFYFSENIFETSIALITNIYHIIWVCLAVYFYRVYLKKITTIKSKNKSFESLRMETIDHLKYIWYIGEHSIIRDAISEELEGYGINVRFKSQSGLLGKPKLKRFDDGTV